MARLNEVVCRGPEVLKYGLGDEVVRAVDAMQWGKRTRICVESDRSTGLVLVRTVAK